MEIDWTNINMAREYINAWASRTFPTRNPRASLNKLALEEVPELLMHLKKQGPEGIGKELADCFILLLDLSVIWNVDIARAMRDKMQINEMRIWQKDEATGYYNHVTLKPIVDQSKAEEIRRG
jgi:NTP pyrophosphatase (non-canonical NTP hydrolase)